jgi:uroporphyrinogen-III synthase
MSANAPPASSRPTRRIAITRAMPEAERTADRLRARGATPILAPLLAIEPIAFDTDLSGVQALLFTSANGVRAFAQASHDRNAPVLAVGEATARAARETGFADVRAGEGDSRALAVLAVSELSPAAGKLLHISGAHVAGDLAGDLAAAGFTAERRIVYAAVAASAPPQAFAGPLDIVLFHSARAAQIYLDLGAPAAGRLTAACLSPAIAAAAAAAPWARLVVAPYPNEAALIDAALSSTDANP